MMFQCPTSGFFLFYSYFITVDKSSYARFNALLRASFFSTIYRDLKGKNTYAVSMPYFGLLSFLRDNELRTYTERKMFQCPTSGFFLFYYRQKTVQLYLIKMFQCPTSGFFLFYSFHPTLRRHSAILFQCPTSGFFLFYGNSSNKRSYQCKKFQCPTSGFFLFYRKMTQKTPLREMFQCPTSGFFLFYAMSLQPLILLAFQPPFCK